MTEETFLLEFVNRYKKNKTAYYPYMTIDGVVVSRQVVSLVELLFEKGVLGEDQVDKKGQSKDKDSTSSDSTKQETVNEETRTTTKTKRMGK